jgi:DNA-binding transcriptional regulator GbsR (MarR family)
MRMEMRKKKLDHIEESGLLFEQTGMTRMAGRIFGYLLICDEDAVSFDQIRKTLQASKGSISTNLKQLVNTSLIEQTTVPGDRKTYYRASRVHIGEIMSSRLNLMEKFVNLFSQASELKTREDDVSEWLYETACFYEWMEDRMEEMMDRWENEKDEILKEI